MDIYTESKGQKVCLRIWVKETLFLTDIILGTKIRSTVVLLKQTMVMVDICFIFHLSIYAEHCVVFLIIDSLQLIPYNSYASIITSPLIMKLNVGAMSNHYTIFKSLLSASLYLLVKW